MIYFELQGEAMADSRSAVKADNTHSEDLTLPEGMPGSTQASSRPISSRLAIPFVDAERFEILELLGSGGMGRVYKARDKKLSRLVALKFMRDDAPEMLGRFLKEAQAQARLDHENICKVFEVGESDGKMYIVMQYIEGSSLKALKHELGTEQKVEILRKVAHALHTAHRQGLVHRDIKPANIMVERRDDGALHPYLMDFGLAREAYTQGQTMTGTVEGTPAYMAPEQVRGEIHRLDRRTDVYSLGASLYELLAGRPPFMGETSIDILMSVTSLDPAALRSIEPSVALDLETIVMKCLEKDPVRRYDSARALALDLQRWLDGEPVSAERASFGYLLLKRVRKHKALFMLGGMAFVAVLLLSGMYFRGKTVARRQALVAQELGQDIKEIELFMRYALALPAHDVEREKELIQERIRRMEARRVEGGQEVQGPANYALGRGYLLLDEPLKAVWALEEALKAGFNSPDVELALGRARSALYWKALDEARRVDDPRLKANREREVEKRYLAPALEHLRKSRGAADMPNALLEASIAQLEKRFSDAARLAEEAVGVSPWLAEARELLGHALLALARQKSDEGDLKAALEALEKATLTFEEVANMLRSDAGAHEAVVDAWMLRLDIDRNRGAMTRETLEKAIEACGKTLVLEPGRATVFQKQTRAFMLWAYDQMIKGKDPRASAEQSMYSAKMALNLNANDAITHDIIGNNYSNIASYEANFGTDPRPKLALARESFERAIHADPGFVWPYNDAGISYAAAAMYESRRGLDPTHSFKQAENYYKRAQELDPQYDFPFSNYAILENARALYQLEHGIDPNPALERAKAICSDTAISLKRRAWCAEPRLGSAIIQGEYERLKNISPLLQLELAMARAELELQEGIPFRGEMYWTLGMAYRLRAHYLQQSGGEAKDDLGKGHASFSKAEELETQGSGFQIELAKLFLLSARDVRQRKEDPTNMLKRAESALEKVIHKNPSDPDAWTLLAELWLLRAPGDIFAIQKGINAADKALAVNTNLAMAFAQRARLYALLAKQTKKPAEKKEAQQKARGDFENVLRINAFLRGEIGQELEALSSTQGPAAEKASSPHPP